MKIRIWVRHPVAQASMDWPKWFWRGTDTVGLALSRLNFMVIYR